MEKQAASSPFKRKNQVSIDSKNSYKEPSYYSDDVADSAKDAIYKYDAVVNDANMVADNSHVMNLSHPTSSSNPSISTEPA